MRHIGLMNDGIGNDIDLNVVAGGGDKISGIKGNDHAVYHHIGDENRQGLGARQLRKRNLPLDIIKPGLSGLPNALIKAARSALMAALPVSLDAVKA